MLAISPTKCYNYPERTRDENPTPHRLGVGFRIDNTRSVNDISTRSQKRLRNAINWLVFLSKKRTVNMYSGRKLKNFRISFITLTLPGKQMHSHKDIIQKCLNNFLTSFRGKFRVNNYVWRVELQANGNIHIHITTDVYIHYMAIRKVWNKAINTLGYVDEYAQTMSKLSFEQYAEYRRQQGQLDTAKITKAYNYGTKTHWRNPNTTDVKKVKTVKNLGAYLSKYLTKKIANQEKTGPYADSLAELSGRLWFCSRSLSGLGVVRFHATFETIRFSQDLQAQKNVYTVFHDYCTLMYYRIKDLSAGLKKFIVESLLYHAIKADYPFPSDIPYRGIVCLN